MRPGIHVGFKVRFNNVKVNYSVKTIYSSSFYVDKSNNIQWPVEHCPSDLKPKVNYIHFHNLYKKLDKI